MANQHSRQANFDHVCALRREGGSVSAIVRQTGFDRRTIAKWIRADALPEQSFDGHGSGNGADRFIREAIFGGEFGSFASRQRHFFDKDGQVYRELQKILKLRRANRVYTRGRQFLRRSRAMG